MADGPPYDFASGPGVDPRLVRAGREVAAWLLAGCVGAMVFLIVAQESANRGWSDHRPVDALGVVVGAEGQDVPRQGFYWSVAASLAIVLVYAAVPVVRRLTPWIRSGLAAATVFVLWGGVLGPLAASRSDEVLAGPFGADAGIDATLVAAVASLAYGVTVARVHGLVISREWWEAKHFDLRASLEEIVQERARVDVAPDRSDDPADHPPIRG
jgi:hypothetical protein